MKTIKILPTQVKKPDGSWLDGDSIGFGDASVTDAHIRKVAETESIKAATSQLSESITDISVLKKSENLYKRIYTDNSNLLADGNEEYNANRCVIEAFEVEPSTTYYLYRGQAQERSMFVRCLQYDASMNLLSALTVVNQQSVTTSSNTRYLRMGVNKTEISDYFSIVRYSTPQEAYTKFESYYEPYHVLKIQPMVDSIAEYVRHVSENYLYTDQAYVKNRKLVCNNDHVNNANTVAKYIKADMGSKVSKIMAKFTTRGGMVALISSPLCTDNNVQDIVNKSVHATFDANACTLILFDNTTSRSIGHFNYSTPLLSDDNHSYVCGFEFVNANTIKVYLPDGTTQNVTDEDIDSHNGNYAIWEFYNNSVTATDVPTLYFARPSFEGFYCKCSSGRTLRDNFMREDGRLNVAPSGHHYILFRNQSSNDLIWDNTNGTNN